MTTVDLTAEGISAQSVVDYELTVVQEQQQGPPGPRGIDANTIWTGSGPPTGGVGVIGDWYINSDTHYLFGPKNVNGWPTGYSMIGPQGATGMTGPMGNQILSGTGGPNNLNGKIGDFYLSTDLNRLYGPKQGDNTWPGTYTSVVGPSGGQTVLSGTATPPSAGTGSNGDFYINTNTWVIYGPKAAGAWPAGVSLVGPQGSQGVKGDTGASGDWSTMTGKPTTVAGFGITNHILYRDVTDTVSVGFTITPYNLGNMSGSVTPSAANGNYQYGTNHGAITLNAPASDCAMDILVTNDATAGAITFSGFTIASGNTGDNLDAVNTHKFIISILRINSVATYMVKALQ